jgi:dolichol kinase
MWTEIRRKSFHLLGFVYLLGLVYIPRPTYLVMLTVWLAVVFAIEQTRLRVPAVARFFTIIAGGLFREKETRKMTGVFWMAEGAWLTVVLLEPIPLAATAFLYLLLGDGIASLAGKRLGGRHWPNSPKRISGSVACFCMCLFIGAVLLRPAFYGWSGIVAGALVATLIEFLSLRLDDNVTIPLAATLTFLVCYGF